MAEIKRKKSFVFNVEWHEVLSDYPAEVRLEVYDAIIEYVASGTLSELRPMAKMAFSFIKKEIDYNNSRYEDTVARRSESGRNGGLKRVQNQANQANASDAKQNQANQANASDAKQNQANQANASDVKQNQANQANASDVKQNQANQAVYDNDNVNDNNILSLSPPCAHAREKVFSSGDENQGERALKEEKADFVPPEIFEDPLEVCFKKMISNEAWISQLTTNTCSTGYTGFDAACCKKYISLYFKEMQNRGVAGKSQADAMSHFASWLKIELKKQKDDTGRAKTVRPVAGAPRAKLVRNEVERGADLQPSVPAQKDYSSRF